MANRAAAAPGSSGTRGGIPLDLAPLVAPFQQTRRLLVRVRQLPLGSRLTRGTKNEDGTWSLMRGDLPGLELLLPEGVKRPSSVAVSLVRIDENGDAAIVAQYDLPLEAPPAPEPSAPTAAAEPARAPGGEVDWPAAEAELKAEFEKRFGEQSKALEEEWRKTLESERAAAEKKFEETERRLAALTAELEAAKTRAAEAEARAASHKGETQRVAEHSKAQSAQEQAAKLAAAEAEWERKAEARVAEALKKAAKESEASLKQAERDAELALKQAQKDAEVARKQTQKDAEVRAAEARKQAEQATEAAVKKAEAAFEARLAAALKQAEKEFDARLAAATKEAEDAAEKRLAEARSEWQAESDRKLAAARALAAEAEAVAQRMKAERAEAEARWKEEGDRRLAEQAETLEAEWRERVAEASRKEAEARIELATLSDRLAKAEASVAAQSDSETRDAQEIAAQVKKQVEVSKVLWEQGNADRIAAAVKAAEEKARAAAETQFQKERSLWEAQALQAMAVAEERWREEEGDRLAAARAEWEASAGGARTSGTPERPPSSANEMARDPLADFSRDPLFDPEPETPAAENKPVNRSWRRIQNFVLIAGGAVAVFVVYPTLKPIVVDELLPRFGIYLGDGGAPAPGAERAEQRPRMTVAASNANLRAGPTTGARVVATLDRDTAVVVIRRSGAWYLVELADDPAVQGWLHQSLIEDAR